MNIEAMNIKKIKKIKRILYIMPFFSTIPLIPSQHVPRVTIVFIVDQCAYETMQKCKNYFKHGLKQLTSRGIQYTNAYYPHSMPATATGHAGLSTGTYPYDHGIISNMWVDETNNLVQAGSDKQENARVFSPTGTYDYGFSSHHVMVDTISDQFVLQSTPGKKYYSYALSMKNYAAAQLSGKLGKAIWFDNKTKRFTTSKAYFKKIPQWVEQFNNENSINNLETITWHQARPKKSNAYLQIQPFNKNYTDLQEGLVGKSIPISLFLKTPHANKHLLDLAQQCLDKHVDRKNNTQLLLWISLSSLDFVGHAFGPESKETFDTLYHLDKQLAQFMRYAQHAVGKKEILFVLTADHGACPIIERLAEKGFPARRYDNKTFIEELNTHLNSLEIMPQEAHNIVTHFQTSNLYFNHELLDSLPQKTQNRLIAAAKKSLKKHPGIKNVWSYNELQKCCFAPGALENYYKNQLYPHRSGHLIVQTKPYCEITSEKKGSNHASPNDITTHVPLILYQHGVIELKTFNQRVLALQLTNTLADILQIPKTSSSTLDILPGIGTKREILLF